MSIIQNIPSSIWQNWTTIVTKFAIVNIPPGLSIPHHGFGSAVLRSPWACHEKEKLVITSDKLLLCFPAIADILFPREDVNWYQCPSVKAFFFVECPKEPALVYSNIKMLILLISVYVWIFQIVIFSTDIYKFFACIWMIIKLLHYRQISKCLVIKVVKIHWSMSSQFLNSNICW